MQRKKKKREKQYHYTRRGHTEALHKTCPSFSFPLPHFHLPFSTIYYLIIFILRFLQWSFSFRHWIVQSLSAKTKTPQSQSLHLLYTHTYLSLSLLFLFFFFFLWFFWDFTTHTPLGLLGFSAFSAQNFYWIYCRKSFHT